MEKIELVDNTCKKCSSATIFDMALSPPEKAPGKEERLKILVVDDDALVRKNIRTLLERDYDVIEAESIAESMVVFDHQKLDLITLDIVLPGVDGMQGLHQFRQRSANIPIILISGHTTFELAQEALRLGATDYLGKPIKPEELYKTVRSALEHARAHENAGQDSSGSTNHLKLRLSLKNLQEESFYSLRHRSHFLAFAQNVLSDKKRTFETIFVRELLEMITMQFEALHLKEAVAYQMIPDDPKLKVDCDMYLLGATLANLVLACLRETSGDRSLFVLSFDCSGDRLRVFFKKSDLHLPEAILARFKDWHQHPDIDLDANTTMLILAENAVKQHHGELIPGRASSSDPLLEISLPLKQPPPC